MVSVAAAGFPAFILSCGRKRGTDNFVAVKYGYRVKPG
jgi:hypothetical protein